MTVDLPAREFAAILGKLPEYAPISSLYESQYLPGSHWWTSQREHMVAWMSEMAGPGAYQRVSRGRTARQAYQSLQCAPALLWMAEALGEDSTAVQAAADEAAGAGRQASQCKIIRSHIPWSRIIDLVYPSEGNVPGIVAK